jgi:hypothetical protein
MRNRTTRALLVLLLLTPAVCRAQPAPAPADPLAEAKGLIERAERAVEQGYSPSAYADPAVELLKQVASRTDPPVEAFYCLGRAYALAGHPALASSCLQHYLDLKPQGQDETLHRARDFVLRTEFVLGCEALSMGRGGSAEPHFAVAARLASDNPLVARKLAASLSGAYNPSREWRLTFPPDDPESPAPLVVNRTEVFPRYAPRAVTRLWAGDLPGAGLDLDKVMTARGTNAVLAGLRAAVYFQSGDGAGALERFGGAYGDPVVPTDLVVLTTRVVPLGGRAYRVARVCEGAVLSALPYSDQSADREQLRSFFAKNEVVAVSSLCELFNFAKPEDDLACRLQVGADGAEVRPTGEAPPKSLIDMLDPDLVATSRLVVFPRPAAPGEFRIALRRGEVRSEATFEDPPLASREWGVTVPTGPAPTQGTTTTPPPSDLTVTALADACLPVLSRTVGQEEQVRAVWMTGRFLEALCRLSANAPDVADLTALRKLSETHLIFMVVAPNVPSDATLAEASVLLDDRGNRRFGLSVDSVTGVPGLSARAKAYGICFPIASRSGAVLPTTDPGQLSLLLGGPEALRFRFEWALPLSEPELLRAALGEGAPR